MVNSEFKAAYFETLKQDYSSKNSRHHSYLKSTALESDTCFLWFVRFKADLYSHLKQMHKSLFGSRPRPPKKKKKMGLGLVF